MAAVETEKPPFAVDDAGEDRPPFARPVATGRLRPNGEHQSKRLGAPLLLRLRTAGDDAGDRRKTRSNALQVSGGLI